MRIEDFKNFPNLLPNKPHELKQINKMNKNLCQGFFNPYKFFFTPMIFNGEILQTEDFMVGIMQESRKVQSRQI